MRKLMIAAAGVAALAASTAPSFAQGVGVDLPGVGVRIGEPGYHRYYRDYDGPRERYRERNVYLRGGENCRTVTIRNDDGYTKRIRRCD